MRFVADKGISTKTVEFIRDLGYDAVHLYDEGLQRLSDSAILQKARDERRVLLAHDLDFGQLMAASQARLPSVVVFRLRRMRPDNVNRYLREVLTHHRSALERGAVISVSEGRARVRLLPLEEDGV